MHNNGKGKETGSHGTQSTMQFVALHSRGRAPSPSPVSLSSTLSSLHSLSRQRSSQHSPDAETGPREGKAQLLTSGNLFWLPGSCHRATGHSKAGGHTLQPSTGHKEVRTDRQQEVRPGSGEVRAGRHGPRKWPLRIWSRPRGWRSKVEHWRCSPDGHITP